MQLATRSTKGETAVDDELEGVADLAPCEVERLTSTDSAQLHYRGIHPDMEPKQ